jgi:hypothetical protein
MGTSRIAPKSSLAADIHRALPASGVKIAWQCHFRIISGASDSDMRNPGLPATPSFLRVSTDAGVPHLLVLKYLAISRQMQAERGLSVRPKSY